MNETVAFAKLFVNVAPENVREALVRLRRSAALTNSVVTVVAEYPKITDAFEGSLSGFIRFIRQSEIVNIVRVARVLNHSKAADLSALVGSTVFSREVLFPKPLLTGEDLIAQGRKPGPAFKRILFYVETQQLEGLIFTKEEALKAVSDWQYEEEIAEGIHK